MQDFFLKSVIFGLDPEIYLREFYMLKKYLYLIIPFLATALCSLLALSSLDLKVADWFQRPLKSTEETKNVIMINVDDTAIDQIGSWPFSRDVYAESLITLRELGTEAVVFDLSFVDKSQAKIDEPYVRETLPEYVDSDFDNLNDKIFDVLGQYADGSLKPEDAEDVATDMYYTTESIKNSLKINISHIVESQDASLATAIKYFDNSFLTLTFDDLTEISDEQKEYLSSYIALDNIEIKNDTKTPEFFNVLPAIPEFMVKAKKAGFVNADPDRDGYLRRVHLVYKYNGKYYGQLVFVPILKHYGNPKVIVKDKEIVLENCRISDTITRNIRIPRAKDGSVLVKYPKKDYIDYNCIGLWNIYRLALLEEKLEATIYDLRDKGFFDYCDEDNSPADAYNNASYVKDSLLNQEEDFTYDDYLAYRNAFFDCYKAFLYTGYEDVLCEDYPEDADDIRALFAECRESFEKYMASREKVAAKVKDAICIIGTNATSTSDYGLTQYEEHYPNPGVHYTIANQLLTQDFVDDGAVWLSILLALLICVFYSFATHRIKGTGHQIIAGGSFIGATIIVFLLFFMLTRCYIGVVVPLTSLFITFITTTIVGFVTTSKDKKFITNAFSQCLSKEVVDDIVANPSSFKLGGQRLEMTAMFTDIQKFSAFSELLTASQLVALLNFYLTKMSNIIMDERGTVDKYEGDAIIALVGAPVKMDDHAPRACAAAIKMKKAEVEMNKYIREVAAAEKPEDMEDDLYDAFKAMVENNKTLFTRIGLNSGEMIAGYMGSENKKNYTMMGNNVNLASRLEGVNKQYRTGGIMISEATRNLLGDQFLVRSLDRVRVVNVNTPIRLYELLDEKELASAEQIEYVTEWEEALKVFEAREYVKAGDMLKKLLEKNPRDSVARYYVSLIDNFFAKGTYPTEKDDVGVAFDENEFVFKLLQK